MSVETIEMGGKKCQKVDVLDHPLLIPLPLLRMIISRVNRFRVELPKFTTARYNRRFNMAEEDRVKFFNWNLASILLTPLPFLYMQLVDYRVSSDTDMVFRTLDPLRDYRVPPQHEVFKN